MGDADVVEVRQRVSVCVQGRGGLSENNCLETVQKKALMVSNPSLERPSPRCSTECQ